MTANAAGRWRRRYVFVVLSVVHAAVLLGVVEFGARLLFAARGQLAPPSVAPEVLAAYPGREEGEVRRLLEETWRRSWRYEPWVGFREAPRRGSFVNISERGFRFGATDGDGERDLSAGGADAVDVYFFGGSTTFGYGVADGETIPSRLEARVEGVRVFNFGRGYYYSAQELALFADLLRGGAVPEVAIFLDGLNEGQSAPFYSGEMRQLFAAFNDAPSRLAGLGLASTWRRSALHRLAEGVARRLGLGPSPSPAATSDGASPADVERSYRAARRQIEALAAEYGVRVYFFIQPVPGYRNAFGDHPLMRYGHSPATAARMELLEATADGRTRFSLAAALDGYGGTAFVDSFHYSPPVNDLLAGAIADRVLAAERARGDGDGDRAAGER
ncbi:MAG: hypothetical protein AAGF23_07760 [Acidobacteriota bacterium]